MSAPIWAVVALLQSWLLASPGEDVRPQDALWSVRPVERRAPYRLPHTTPSTRETVPALTLDLRAPECVTPRAVPPIRIDGLCLCGADWSRFPDGLEPEPRAFQLPLTPTWTPSSPGGHAANLREGEVDAYLGELEWRQPLWCDPEDGSFTDRVAADWTIRIVAPDDSDRLGIGDRFEDGSVAWSRYIDDDPQRAFIREALNSVGLPDGIYWNRAVFLPTAGFGNTTYWFGVSMSLKW